MSNNVVPFEAGPFSAEAPSQPRVQHGQGSSLDKIFAMAQVVILEMYRRKDFYVLFILTMLISAVLATVNIFGDDKIVRYLKEICLLLIWVSSLVIAITTTARQIPAEREARTLFPLLSKPVSRSQVVLGKFLGCWLATGISLICFYLFFAVLSGIKDHQWPITHYLQAGFLHWTMLGIVIAMTLLGSVIFAAPSSNSTILLIACFVILYLGRHLNKVAMGLPEPVGSIAYAVYFVIPHLEFFDVRELIVHGWDLVPWTAFAGAIAYGVVYIGLFLGFACIRFRRQAVN